MQRQTLKGFYLAIKLGFQIFSKWQHTEVKEKIVVD
jgi:hypothetical protein